MWHDTGFTRLLGLRYPIVQGPFGGGLSSPTLVAAVSEAGGLGSFGAQGMRPAEIEAVARDIRALTSAPFALNLWISTADARAADVSRAAFDAALAPLLPFFAELGIAPPPFPCVEEPDFDSQIDAVLAARPAAFSFVFGVPPADVLDRCRTLGIRTIGAATTVDEARALADAGADAIVATGFEAGGHRPSFLRPAEASLIGTLALVPQVVDAVRVPVVAAGGLADARGVAAALALGAQAAQLGTAFLACDESNASPLHRAALRGQRPASTVLTRGFTGRLGRGVRNRLAEALDQVSAPLPYPYQGQLISPLKRAAIAGQRAELAPLWSGQSAPLLRHVRAAELFSSLIDGVHASRA